jgi:hypothetical protein
MRRHRIFVIVQPHLVVWPYLNNAGIINENVDPAKLADCFLNGMFDLFLVAHIARNRDDTRAGTLRECVKSACRSLPRFAHSAVLVVNSENISNAESPSTRKFPSMRSTVVR